MRLGLRFWRCFCGTPLFLIFSRIVTEDFLLNMYTIELEYYIWVSLCDLIYSKMIFLRRFLSDWLSVSRLDISSSAMPSSFIWDNLTDSIFSSRPTFLSNYIYSRVPASMTSYTRFCASSLFWTSTRNAWFAIYTIFLQLLIACRTQESAHIIFRKFWNPSMS